MSIGEESRPPTPSDPVALESFGPRIHLPTGVPRLDLRRFRAADAERLVEVANDSRVSAFLRDSFPFPYTRADADKWLSHIANADGLVAAAITLDDRVVGGIGAVPGSDVERFSAEVGYWLGVDFWGRGYATAAVSAYVEHLFATTRLIRLTAQVYEGNPASGQVLVKAGFHCESTARHAVVKGGLVRDMNIYVRLRHPT